MLEASGIELICLAGFMRLLTAGFVDHWRDRMINIHPSLLPAFPGLDTHARALAEGVRFVGCTVHFVRTEMDHGPIIVQAAIGMAGAVLAEATLSFLGLGLPPPAASWGGMLNDARSHLFDSPHMVVFPAIAVMLCVLSFNFIGDALRDYLDPRTRLLIGL